MDTHQGWLIPLSEAAAAGAELVGGKAAQLAALSGLGYRVPDGFCVTAQAYGQFVRESGLSQVIRMELGRKSFHDMRWEEMWDAALRIRSAFLRTPIPESVAGCVHAALERLGVGSAFAVRSSAPAEDSAERSFAGLHESLLDVVGAEAVLDAIRVVWSSLWSDAALLYRRELGLDPSRSQMAVVVQEMVHRDRSGVAFGRDPRSPEQEHAVIEAVPGPCSGLVDGVVDPDRWILSRTTGQVVEYRQGERDQVGTAAPLLDGPDLEALRAALRHIEAAFAWPPDLEWTGRARQLCLLQARPITSGPHDTADERRWYLSLRPAPRRLRELGRRVTEELIPELERQGQQLAGEPLKDLKDEELADAIGSRLAAVRHWREVYRDQFIPFAHGVRRLATTYNDAVRPQDPYEFVGLLQGEDMLASRRNRALAELASRISGDPALRLALEQALAQPESLAPEPWMGRLGSALEAAGAGDFLQDLASVQQRFMDTSFAGERLADRPDRLLATLLQTAAAGPHAPLENRSEQLERRLLHAVGRERHAEVMEVLATGRLSWRLRDDDNLLLGRLESQLLRVLSVAAERLRARKQLGEGQAGEKDAPALEQALRRPDATRVVLSQAEPTSVVAVKKTQETPRQLTGQPAAPGIATGRVRCVRTAQDLARFRSGEVLVCDAIQPNMTHLVPLASAVVERRGGMLIHGAIIARELGLPCVNGVPRACELLQDGDLVTVDGHLGIVSVGHAEFDLEREAGQDRA